MKKTLVLCLALGLSGCVTSTSSLIPTETTITAQAKQVQNYVRLGCSFVPTIATVVAILSKGSSAGVASIAEDICTAVTTAPLADGPGDHLPRVKGVVIKGRKV